MGRLAATFLLVLAQPGIAAATGLSCIFKENAIAIARIEYEYKVAGTGELVTEQGTGFVITPNGHILTNFHVVSPRDTKVTATDEKFRVRLGGWGESERKATVVRRDQQRDLAILIIPRGAEDFKTVGIGGSLQADVGQPLVGLGFPESDLALVDRGIITARNAVTPSNELKPFWQTSLPLNPGNSGGPVFNPSGAVIGIAVAVRRNVQLITYVIPISDAEDWFTGLAVKRDNTGPCSRAPLTGTWRAGEQRESEPLGMKAGEGVCYLSEVWGQFNSVEDSVRVTVENGEYRIGGKDADGGEHGGTATCVEFQ